MIARTQIIKVIRGTIIAANMSFRLTAQKFRENDYGWTRLETARKILDDIGLETEEVASMQIIPCGDECFEVRLRAK